VRGPVVFISAGEPSGDAHAGRVAEALRSALPGVTLIGCGGPHLDAAGVELVARTDRLTVMGLAEAVARIPAHLALLRTIRRRLGRGDVSLVVLVDYPGFHLRVARLSRQLGIPVLYYVAPKVWAWGRKRVRKVARDVSRLAVILPFEERFFREHGIEARFVGNPLLERPAWLPREEAKRALGLDPARPVVGVFPGSRGQETRRLWPVFREAFRLVRQQRPEVQGVVAATAVGSYDDPGDLVVVQDRPRECFAAADASLCKSGTTTLEAALAGSPMVVAYRMNWLTWQLARRLVKVSWVSLVNLVAAREVVPELLQSEATPQALAAALLPLLDPHSRQRAAQLEGIAEVRRLMGGPGAAGRVAELAREMLAA
jgi:lipid-A-disaccharide synthase